MFWMLVGNILVNKVLSVSTPTFCQPVVWNAVYGRRKDVIKVIIKQVVVEKYKAGLLEQKKIVKVMFNLTFNLQFKFLLFLSAYYVTSIGLVNLRGAREILYIQKWWWLYTYNDEVAYDSPSGPHILLFSFR